MAIIGMILFGENDPWHFGRLHLALLSLFRLATVDNAANVAYVNMFGCDMFGDVYDIYPEQCVKPVAGGVMAAFYFLLMTIVGAQTLLSLFIGVIATSMEEAKDRQKVDQKLDAKIIKTAEKLMLTPERVGAFRDVYNLLDLDGGGTIDEEELKIGLEAIDAHLPEERLVEILAKIDPEGNGIDADSFIWFMTETPYYNKEDLAMSNLNNLMSKGKKKGGGSKAQSKPKEPFYQCLIDVLVYGGKANRLKEQEEEAALIIQDEWSKYLARQEAKKVFLEKKAAKDRALKEKQEKEKQDEEFISKLTSQAATMPGK